MLNSVLQNAIGTRWVLLASGYFALVLCCALIYGTQAAGFLYASGSLIISFAPPFPVVMAGLVLMGLGGGFYEASLTSVISHVSSS